jgi:hypothetical protein
MIMTDFDKSNMNAASFVCPNSKIQGCFFHLGQSIWHQIQSIDLSNRYFTDPEFSLNIRKIPALAYSPENLIDDSFERLLETEFYKK